jgi:hypothetical protein
MQHANLKGRSTKPTLQDFAYKVDGSVALGVFLDEEGAFENTSFELDAVCEWCLSYYKILRWTSFKNHGHLFLILGMSTGGCFIALAMEYGSQCSIESSGGLQLFYARICRCCGNSHLLH